METKAAELTGREVEVLLLLVEGHTNREVASQLYISTRTVEFHRANIQGKLSAKGRAELMRSARSIGLTG
jgi:two-component system, NarL family, response regulator NreC